MIASMKHESFYDAGLHSVPDLGIYAGWVAHENSFAAGQTFSDESGDIALLFAGECFLEPELTNELSRRGHRLNGNTSNPLPHLYEEQGDDFFENLNGQFSGLLVDRRQRRAFLFNDRYGFARIYCHEARDAFYFASEAKALLRVLPELREFDREGVAQFLAFGCTLNWRTLFRGVDLLPGGSLRIFDTGTCHKSRYFEARAWESLAPLSITSFESRFEETFKRVLPRYVASDATLGISLTGGLDTRMVMAWLSPTEREPVCYTYTGTSGKTFDDRVAAKVAAACGLDHTLVRLGSDFFSNFAYYADRTVYLTDGAFGIAGAHEVYLSERARQLAPVRLTGLFGSEILRGFSTLRPAGLTPALFDPEFRPFVIAARRDGLTTLGHPTTEAAFKNVPWNLFGSAAAGGSQLTLRTPYLDNELVALAFQIPESLRKSPQTALRLVQDGNPALVTIPTDRGIGGDSPAVVTKLRRLFLQATFKLDYLYNEGMPHRFLRFDSLLSQVDSRIRLFGHHKFLHYRLWFRNELASYVSAGLSDSPTQANRFWNPEFRNQLASAHAEGRRNYGIAINAVLTLEAVERLLFRDLPRGTSLADHSPVASASATATVS